MKRFWKIYTVSFLLALTGCTSFEDIKNQADAGNSDMQYKAAIMLMEGDGTVVDRDAAEKYLLSAFNAGNPYAACHIIKDIYQKYQGDQTELLLKAYDILFAKKKYLEAETTYLLAEYPADAIKYMAWLDKSGYTQSAFTVKKHLLANINKSPLRRKYIYQYTLQTKSFKTAFEKAEEKRIAAKKAEEKRIADKKIEEKYIAGYQLWEKIRKSDPADTSVAIAEKVQNIKQAQQYFTEAVQNGHTQAATALIDLIFYKQHPALKKDLPFYDESEMLMKAWAIQLKTNAKTKVINKAELQKVVSQIGSYSYYLGRKSKSRSALVEFAKKYQTKDFNAIAIYSLVNQAKLNTAKKEKAQKEAMRIAAEKRLAAPKAEEKRLAAQKAEEEKRLAEKHIIEKQNDPAFKYPHSAISAKRIKLYKEFESGSGLKWFEQDVKIKSKNNNSKPNLNLYYNLPGAISYNRYDMPGVTFVFGRDSQNKQNLLQCINGPLFACRFSVNNASLQINDLVKKFQKEYPGVKHKQYKKLDNQVNKRIQGTLLLIKMVSFTDILESEDVKIVISHRDCETVFSEGARKLKPEEKNAIEISLAYMKDQFKGFEIEVVDKNFAVHFAQQAKQEKQLMEKRWAEEKKKAAEKALDF